MLHLRLGKYYMSISPYTPHQTARFTEQTSEKPSLNKDSNWEWLKIIGTGVTTSVIYGIANDLLQINVCPEFWTVGHFYENINFFEIDPVRQPILNAVVWGTTASWWVGAIGGAAIAAFSQMPLPCAKRKVKAQELVEPLAVITCTGLVAGHIVSRIVKDVYTKSVKAGLSFHNQVPPNIQPGWFSCAYRDLTGYYVAAAGVGILCTAVLLKRYFTSAHKNPPLVNFSATLNSLTASPSAAPV